VDIKGNKLWELKMKTNGFCKKCGDCCRTQEPITWMGSPILKTTFDGETVKVVSPDISDIILNKSGGCEMLNKDNLCSLQVKFGYDSKPQGCGDFTEEDCKKFKETKGVTNDKS
jgi:hypothetical protein